MSKEVKRTEKGIAIRFENEQTFYPINDPDMVAYAMYLVIYGNSVKRGDTEQPQAFLNVNSRLNTPSPVYP